MTDDHEPNPEAIEPWSPEASEGDEMNSTLEAAQAQHVRGEALPGAQSLGVPGVPLPEADGECSAEIDPAALEAALDAILADAAAALSDERATSADLAGLVASAEALRPQIKRQAGAVSKIALAPGTTRAEIREAQQRAEMARLDLQRLDAAITRLDARVEEISEAEEAKRAEQNFARARQALAKADRTLRELGPKVGALRSQIDEAIAEANGRVRVANMSLPKGRIPLEEIDLLKTMLRG